MTERSTMVRAWDWPTRAFHWLLVASLIWAWLSFRFATALGDPMLVYHRWNGYFILTLVVFRLIWGFVGSSTARFALFVPSPRKLLNYMRQSLSGATPPYLSHNPLGTMMVLMLLSLVAIQAIGGLFSLEHNELVAGPLKRLVSHETSVAITKWHVVGLYIILGFAVVHVTANTLYGLVKKEPLIPAMVHGRKEQRAYADAQDADIPADITRRAAAAYLASVIVVFGGIWLAGGRIF